MLIKLIKYFGFYIATVCLFSLNNIASGSQYSGDKAIHVQVHSLNINHGFDLPVTLRFTYTNRSNSSVELLTRDTALAGRIQKGMLEISYRGDQLEYLGPIFKQLLPSPDEYITLKPNESRYIDLAVDTVYSLHKPGAYRISYTPRPGLVAQSTPFEIKLTQARLALKVTPAFKACTADRSNKANSALSIAEAYSSATAIGMRTVADEKRSESPRYKEWFGAYTAQRWNKVQTNFNRIATAATTKRITFDCGCADGSSNTIAYVYPSREYEVYLCPLFWNLRRSGTDSQAGTIIHELSHFNSIANTDDRAYGLTNSRNLARQDPNAAVINAESHQFFAENPGNLPWIKAPGGNPGTTPIPPEPEKKPDLFFLNAIYQIIFNDDTLTTPTEPQLPEHPQPIPESNIQGLYSIAINSSAGEEIGKGKSFIFNQRNSNVEIQARYKGSLDISIEGVSQHNDSIPAKEQWHFYLQSKEGADLTPGVYFGSSDGRYGPTSSFSISRAGVPEQCSRTQGVFNIFEIEYANDEIVRLLADFKQTCRYATPSIQASIDFDSSRESLIFDSSSVPVGTISPAIEPLSYNGAAAIIDSEAGSPLGGNVFHRFDSSKDRISYSTYSPAKTLFIQLNSGDEHWYITLGRGAIEADIRSQSKLTPGTYFSSDSGSFPGIAPQLKVQRLSFAQQGCDFRGQFRIFEIEFDDATSQILKLTADLKGKCYSSNGEVRASIRIDNTLNNRPYSQPPPPVGSMYPPQTPLSYAGARLSMQVPFGQVPTTTIDSSVNNFDFTATKGSRPSIKLDINGLGYSETIVMTKAEDSDDPMHRGYLSPGIYQPAAVHRFPGSNPKEPTFYIRSVFGGCNLARFTIYSIAYNELDELVKLDADFISYRCGVVDPIRGSITFDATLSPRPFPPLVPPTGALSPAIPSLVHAGAIFKIDNGDPEKFQTFTSQDSNFNLRTQQERTGFRLQIDSLMSSSGITFDRSMLQHDPYKDDPLAPGEYQLSVGGQLSFNSGQCTPTIKQSVRIFEIVYNTENQIDRLVADFLRTCGSGPVERRASVRYDATLTPAPYPEPVSPKGPITPALPLGPQNAVRIIDRDTNLEYGTTDIEIYYVVASPTRGVSMAFRENGEDFSALWTLRFNQETLDINPNSNSVIKPGHYVASGGLTNGVSAQLQVTRVGSSCNIGTFNIFELEYKEDGAVTKFLADFVQTCPGTGRNFSGSIRYNRP